MNLKELAEEKTEDKSSVPSDTADLMIIGDRLRALGEEKGLSQGDIAKRTGVPRSNVSRVESNYSVPRIETLEKWAEALEIPLYAIFYDGDAPPQAILSNAVQPGEFRENAQFVAPLRRTLARIDERHRQLPMQVAWRLDFRKRVAHK